MRVPSLRRVEILTHDLALVEQIVEGPDSLLDRGGEVRAVREDDVGVPEGGKFENGRKRVKISTTSARFKRRQDTAASCAYVCPRTSSPTRSK